MGRDAAAIRDHLKDPRRGKGAAGAPRDRGQIGGRNLQRCGDRPVALATEAVTTGTALLIDGRPCRCGKLVGRFGAGRNWQRDDDERRPDAKQKHKCRRRSQ
jgi:hypothetical protein